MQSVMTTRSGSNVDPNPTAYPSYMVEIRNMGAYAVKLTRRYWLVKLARSVNRVHDGVLNTYYVVRVFMLSWQLPRLNRHGEYSVD